LLLIYTDYMINMQDKTMSPRPYRMGKREAATDQTRSRILEAARQLLANESETALSMEAIARRANVSRLTLYYQFKSRPGLLEALYDYLAIRGNMRRMAEVFHEADPSFALEKLVLTFVAFWSSDPVVIRRLRGMATLDAEIDQGIRARDARRQHAAHEIIRRTVLGGKKKLSTEQQNLTADVLSMLTSFESYDALARSGHKPQAIITTLTLIARAVVDSADWGGQLDSRAFVPKRKSRD
jgi:AcrR family transcriptional regulator